MFVKKEWSNYNPVRLYCGAGFINRLATIVPGGKILLVTTKGFVRRGLVAKITEHLGSDRVIVYDEVTPNPELETLDMAHKALKTQPVEAVIALGGGSVMDSAKVLGVTLAVDFENPLDITMRQNRQFLWNKRIPVIAVPTTSGTGAEVTPFATVWDTTTHSKFSLVNEYVYPESALLDPELTLTLPPNETLYTALDAISHAMESIWNKNATPLSVLYAKEALQNACHALPVILKDPGNIGHRAKMQNASLLAGLAISQTRTAIAHSMSYPLTNRLRIPHGLACSFTLVAVYNYIKQTGNTLKTILPVGELEQVVDLLRTLQLSDHIKRFATQAEVESLTSEMYNPARADNFILQLEMVAISNIIKESFR